MVILFFVTVLGLANTVAVRNTTHGKKAMLAVVVLAIHNDTFYGHNKMLLEPHIARLDTIFPFRSRVVLLAGSSQHYLGSPLPQPREQRAEKCYETV